MDCGYPRCMLGRTYDAQNCSAARALESVGERWSLLIIRDAVFRGMTRFSEFQRSLGIAPNVLASRLAWFVESGLMNVERISGDSDLSNYLLTEKGRELGSVVIALTAWGDKWAAPMGPPVQYQHQKCEKPVHQVVICDACNDEVPIGEVIARPVAKLGTRKASRQV